MRRPYFFIQCIAALVSVSMLATAAYAQQKTAKACETEWRANKTTIQASGKKKKDFITECRAETAQTTATAPANPPAQTRSPKPPAQAAAPASPQATPVPATPPASTTATTQENATPPRSRRAREAATPTAGQYATEAEAKSHCPGDTVVWANTRSKVYHFAGSRTYGKTKVGAYMCERDTVAAGIRSARNEKRPKA